MTTRTDYVPNHQLDAVYQWLKDGNRLPTHSSDWLMKNAKLAYSFMDTDGDTFPAFYCADCAEKHVKTDTYIRCRYPVLGSAAYLDDVICDDCFADISN